MPSLPRSLPRICVALGLPTPEQLSRSAEKEYKDGSTFLELRLDYLRQPPAGADVIRDLLRRYPDIYLLATCRHKSNHGSFSGSVHSQIALLKEAAAAGAVAVDLEIESAEAASKATQALRQLVPLIVSYHNFVSTGSLEMVKRRLLRVPADAYKIVTTARRPS